MDRNELTFAIAGALIAAMLLGWLIGAVAARLWRRGGAAEAQAAVRRAERHAAAVEADCARRIAEAETAAAHARAEAEGLRAALESRGAILGSP